MHRYLILGGILILGPLGCAKPKPPEPLSIEDVQAARQHFNRHLMAIGAGSMGLPHTGYKMNGTMEIIGQPGKNVFSMEQKIPNLYYIRISLSGTGVFERGYDGEQFWERTPRESRFLDKEEVISLQATSLSGRQASWSFCLSGHLM